MPLEENGKSRLRLAQEEVEEVKIIMLDNLNKANERSGKLGELEDRANKLEEQAKTFEKTAGKLKQKKCWENFRMKILLGVIVVIVALLLVIVLLVTLIPNKPLTDNPVASQPPPSTDPGSL